LLLGHSVICRLSASTFFAFQASERHTLCVRRFVARRDKPAALVGISNSNPRRAPLVDFVFTLTSDELLVAAACRKC
jgi:hypothetical protein